MTKLPVNPSLENLKKQAKTLLKAWRAGSADALARVRAAHPKPATTPRLADCQLVLAREAGFASWAQLKVAVEAAHRELPGQFVELACLCYDDPHFDHRNFHARAHQMQRENPWLAEADIWSAAAAGNATAIASFLDDDPSLVNRPGPHTWAPLICACYSRVPPLVPSHSTFEAAKLLLDRGADPNAFTLKGNADERLDQAPRRFTALAGLVGGGSTGAINQPPHPRWRELAELLLARGANPADEVALRLNQDACLDLLLRHSLNPDAMGLDGITLMGRALSEAARRGNIEQVRLLLAHDARTDERFHGKLPWEHAVRLGRSEVCHVLEQSGAPVPTLDDLGMFIASVMAGNPVARIMLKADPTLHARAPQDLVHRAVWTRNIAAVELALDLGFDANAIDDNAAIHHAGVFADRYDILRLLLARGASLKLRDPWYDSTGIGWADFMGFTELRDRMLNEPGICLLDALDYGRFDRIPEILADDPTALERPFAQCLTREPKPGDAQTPLVRAVVRGNAEAVRVLLAHGADATAHHPDGQSLIEVARDKGFTEIAALLAT